MALPVRHIEAPRPRPPAANRAETTGGRRGVSTAPSTATRPDLRVVPRRRAAVNAALLLLVVIVVLMLATVVLHTRLTERQLKIDQLEQDVTDARARFDVLRKQRAELRSPTRLALQGRDLGMVASPSGDFVTVDGRTLAEVIAAAGTVDDVTNAVDPSDPLDQFRRVKAATQGD
jgi:cell division protein FtsL